MQTHLTVIRSVTFDTTTVVLASVQLMSSFIFFFQASTYPQPFHLGCFINIKVRNTDTTKRAKIQCTMIHCTTSSRQLEIPYAYLLFCRVTRWVSLGWLQCEGRVKPRLYSFLTSIEPNSI